MVGGGFERHIHPHDVSVACRHLTRIREKRMNELKAGHKDKVENLSKGHGQYREITQDEFLPEVTGSKNVICHFYHNEFMRCKIMDKVRSPSRLSPSCMPLTHTSLTFVTLL